MSIYCRLGLHHAYNHIISPSWNQVTAINISIVVLLRWISRLIVPCVWVYLRNLLHVKPHYCNLTDAGTIALLRFVLSLFYLLVILVVDTSCISMHSEFLIRKGMEEIGNRTFLKNGDLEPDIFRIGNLPCGHGLGILVLCELTVQMRKVNLWILTCLLLTFNTYPNPKDKWNIIMQKQWR